MNKQVRISVPNSVLLVMDQSIGEIPESMNGRLVSASASCVAVGTASEADEQVAIQLVDKLPETDPRLCCVSTSSIHTPTREVAVCSVFGERYLSIDVPGEFSQIEVWVNDETEPNNIVIVVQ